MNRRATLPALVGLLAAGAARADGLEAETVAQVRHDLFGERYVSAWQFLRLDGRAGPVSVDGYAALDASAGLDQPLDSDVYLLSLSGDAGPVGWSAGRMETLGALRPQTLDGARLAWGRSGVSLDLAGGVARAQALDDLLDGAGFGRLSVAWLGSGLQVRAGLQGETGADTPTIARQDLDLRVSGSSRARPWAGGRLVAAEPLEQGGPAVLEWARLDAGLAVGGGASVAAHGQRREAADPDSLFGDALIEAFAGGAVSEAGASLRVSGARWSALSAGYALVSYERADGASWGHAADASWSGSAGGIRVTPSWSFRAGPGGAYHAVASRVEAPLSDTMDLDVRLGIVPYRKGHDAWDVAMTLGSGLSCEVHRHLVFSAQADVARDALSLLDVRGGGSLLLRFP